MPSLVRVQPLPLAGIVVGLLFGPPAHMRPADNNRYAGVAQWLERQPSKLNVVSSSLIARFVNTARGLAVFFLSEIHGQCISGGQVGVKASGGKIFLVLWPSPTRRFPPEGKLFVARMVLGQVGLGGLWDILR
jgi:hypothetical protein